MVADKAARQRKLKLVAVACAAVGIVAASVWYYKCCSKKQQEKQPKPPSTNVVEQKGECSICQNPYDTNPRILACGHAFHQYCLAQWCGIQKDSYRKNHQEELQANTCPNCRRAI